MARGWDREALRADFLAKRLVTETGCWVLRGFRPGRYDFVKVEGRNVGVHIVAAWVWKDLPPLVNPHRKNSLTMHVCDNPPCWNPDHLVRGTALANVADAVVKGRRPRRWGVLHCVHGHSFTPENTRIVGRHRQCRTCGRQRRAAWRHRMKAMKEQTA
jgi:hypothetical protein